METFAPKGKIYGPIIPQFVLAKPITLGAKIMYALLCNYASEKDHCWPSHATLASRLSCSVSSVKNYLTELVRVNLIEVRREQYRSSVYYLLFPADLQIRPAKNDCPQPKADCREPNSGYLNNLNKQIQEKNPPLPPTEQEQPKAVPVSDAPSAGCAASLAQDFEKAWELYPKKDAKGFARMAWFKLYRSGLLPALSEILESIRRFAASGSWQRDQGRFVPQMGNWLRGQRWLDPLSPAEEAEAKERQHRSEQERAIQAQEERERRLQEQRNAEKERLRPAYGAFAAKFTKPVNEAMAFGTWLYLHSKGSAPSALDVPLNNTLGIIDFMNAFRRQREEAVYRANTPLQQTKRAALRADGFMPCGEILRDSPIFSRLFSGTGELRQAV